MANATKTRRLTVWAPMSPAVYLRRPVRSLPFPLQESGVRLWSRARHGLFEGVRALGLGVGDSVLMPAYNCGSEVEALARAGVTCVFYDISEELRPQEHILESLLTPDVKALYVIHYFGFPQDVERWRKWCSERDLLLIEDAAMAWLSSLNGRPTGSFGNLALFCLYKSVGLPDGGCTIANTPARPSGTKATLGVRELTIRHASWLAQRSSPIAALHFRLGGLSPRLSRLTPSEDEFELGDPDSRPSRATERLLSRTADAAVAERRRANYRYLMERLADVVEPIFPELPAGASPVGFPIWASPERQNELLAVTARYGVIGSRFWKRPHPTLDQEKFPHAAFARYNSFVLPVHQELRTDDLERVAAAVRDAAPIPTPPSVD
jgi:hypothetical protein